MILRRLHIKFFEKYLSQKSTLLKLTIDHSPYKFWCTERPSNCKLTFQRFCLSVPLITFAIYQTQQTIHLTEYDRLLCIMY